MIFFPSPLQVLVSYWFSKSPNVDTWGGSASKTSDAIIASGASLDGSIPSVRSSRSGLIGVSVSGHLLRNLATDNTVCRQENSCWESFLGAELYRLVLLDLLFQIIFSLILVALRFGFRNSDATILTEFSVSRNSLHLVYNQTLVWAGMYFSPLITLVAVIKLVMVFYLQKWQLLHTMKPSGAPWRATQTETVLCGLVLVSLIVASLGNGLVIVRGCSCCGPLAFMCPYGEVITLLAAGNWVLTVVKWTTDIRVVTFLIGGLLILVACLRAVAQGRAELVDLLRKQLLIEEKDRAFLLDLTHRMRRGNGQLPISPGSPNYHLDSPAQRNSVISNGQNGTPNGNFSTTPDGGFGGTPQKKTSNSSARSGITRSSFTYSPMASEGEHFLVVQCYNPGWLRS